MTTSTLYHGCFQTGADHRELTEKVLSFCPCTRRLYLLGLSYATRRTESLFTSSSATLSHISHYYLLVVVQKPLDASVDSLQDKLENNLQHWIAATCIVVSEERFSGWLVQGHPFAGAVACKGLLLYESEAALPLPTPPILDPVALQEETHRLYRHTTQLVGELLAGARLFELRHCYPLSAFLLHQAAEQALRTMVILFTGYRPSTHNLDKLLRYASMFCHPLPELFTRSSEKEKRLLALLSHAYLQPRYSTAYIISLEDLQLLTQKVVRLQLLFDEHCSRAVKDQQLTASRAPL